MPIQVNIFKIHPDAQLPQYASSGACAFDLPLLEDATIAPGEVARLRTGLAICVPVGYALLISGRSSMPRRFKLVIPHGYGLIDPDYCGPEDEILIQVLNPTTEPVNVKQGDRLVQGLFVPISQVAFQEVTQLEAPNRGGFGSTG